MTVGNLARRAGSVERTGTRAVAESLSTVAALARIPLIDEKNKEQGRVRERRPLCQTLTVEPTSRVSTESGNDHSTHVASHLYDKIRHDVAFRKEVAERIGSGFDIGQN
jgi:hypothetical protein